jgi:threonylcarbamoyladenosine tRNA methylthiotransferase MtaB
MSNKITNIAYYTLGCKVNFSETSFLANNAEKSGFQKVRFNDIADVYVIHSCILTSQAEKKTRNAIARAHRKNINAPIIVMGCVSQLKAEEMKKLPGVTHVLGNESKFKLPDILKDIQLENQQVLADDDLHSAPNFHISWSVNDRTRSFLKIQDGCDCYCNYCIVPFARGKSRSARISEVLEATENITSAGFNEIVLTGINLGDFGKHNTEYLPDLLFKMSQNHQLKRIRLSSLEPQHFNESLFQVLEELPKVMPHFHLPLQSGDNNTLQRMGRTYTTKDIEHIIHRLEQTNSSVCIAADIITGFPGETEEEFISGAEFLKKIPLAYMHVFKFSSRKNTKAANLPDHVNPQEKKRRTARLLEISASKKAEFYSKAKNQIRSVLPESENKRGMMFGFTDNYIRVKFPFQQHLINTIVEVQLLEFIHSEYVYLGKIIEIHE